MRTVRTISCTLAAAALLSCAKGGGNRSVTVSASSAYSENHRAENAVDGKEATEWAAKGSLPATFTLTPSQAGILESIHLRSRHTTLNECWKTVRVVLHRGASIALDKKLSFDNAATQPIQEIPVGGIETDKIELFFSDPVLTKISGETVDPGAVNPGYAEISLHWK